MRCLWLWYSPSTTSFFHFTTSPSILSTVIGSGILLSLGVLNHWSENLHGFLFLIPLFPFPLRPFFTSSFQRMVVFLISKNLIIRIVSCPVTSPKYVWKTRFPFSNGFRDLFPPEVQFLVTFLSVGSIRSALGSQYLPYKFSFRQFQLPNHSSFGQVQTSDRKKSFRMDHYLPVI